MPPIEHILLACFAAGLSGIVGFFFGRLVIVVLIYAIALPIALVKNTVLYYRMWRNKRREHQRKTP